MSDEKPSIYFNNICHEPGFRRYPFSLLLRLRDTMQSPKHHPEGSVWNHTVMVVDEAAKVKSRSSNEAAFMWAALLHDIGKPDTTKIRNEKITSYNHEAVGANMARKFLQEFDQDEEFTDKVAGLIRWHMQILFVVNDLPFARIKEMKEQVDIREIALLGLCDRLGRLNADREKEEENIRLFLKKCGQVSGK